MPLRAAALFLLVLLVGCGIVPGAQEPAAPRAAPTTLPTPSAAASVLPSPAAAGCRVSVVDDRVGSGQTFSGTGFPADVPLVMSLTGASGDGVTFTEADFAELRSDVRGAFELHLFANRENIGGHHLEVAGGGCVAAHDFEVKAINFPAAACEAADEPPAHGSPDSDAYESTVLDDEPIAYYRFEDEPGGPVSDATGGDPGEAVGEVSLAQPGFVAGSWSALLRGGDAWVDVPDIALDGDFTIEGWIRFCGEAIDSADALVGQAGEGPDINFHDWQLRLWTGGGDAAIVPFGAPREDWFHIAITRADGAIILYQKGQRVTTGPYADVFPIKALGAGNAGTLEGWLDEVAIYDHALSGERIAVRAAFAE